MDGNNIFLGMNEDMIGVSDCPSIKGEIEGSRRKVFLFFYKEVGLFTCQAAIEKNHMSSSRDDGGVDDILDHYES